jgi:hypothetical protein
MAERLTFSPIEELDSAHRTPSEQSIKPPVIPLKEPEVPKEEGSINSSSAEATVFESPTPSFAGSTKELDRISSKGLLLRYLKHFFLRK